MDKDVVSDPDRGSAMIAPALLMSGQPIESVTGGRRRDEADDDDDAILRADNGQLLKLSFPLELRILEYRSVVLDFLHETRKALDLAHDAIEALENNIEVPEMGEVETIQELQRLFEKKPCNENRLELIRAVESAIHRGVLIGMKDYLRHRTQFEEIFKHEHTISILKTKGNIVRYDGSVPLIESHIHNVMELDFIKDSSTLGSGEPIVEEQAEMEEDAERDVGIELEDDGVPRRIQVLTNTGSLTN
ncbi:hypothetical protein IFR05_008195 [Cadophora sp. M221]|nr:hypothetical protein IFR05_008195 [Cadophora sp. M221]